MDLSKLSANQKLAVFGAAAAVVGGLLAALTYNRYGSAWLAVLGGAAMLGVVFLPQQRPGTSLPGSTGTLMLLAGGITGALIALLFLANIGFTFTGFAIGDVYWLVAVAGSVVMAWAGWQAFQAEGGKFQLGSDGAATSTTASATPPAEPPPPTAQTTPAAAPEAPREAAAPPAEQPPADSAPPEDEQRPTA